MTAGEKVARYTVAPGLEGGVSKLVDARDYDTLLTQRDALEAREKVLVELVKDVLRAHSSNTQAIRRAMGVTWARRARALLSPGEPQS